MNALPTSDLREKLAEITGRVQFAGERVAVQKHGKTVAVLVPPSDLDALKALEERLDLLDALDALADYRQNGGSPFEDLKADLGRQLRKSTSSTSKIRKARGGTVPVTPMAP